MVWSVYKTPEIPPTEEELLQLKLEKENDTIFTPFVDIFTAIIKMPKILWQFGTCLLISMVCAFLLLAVRYANDQA